jgi:homoserine kinase type II
MAWLPGSVDPEAAEVCEALAQDYRLLLTGWERTPTAVVATPAAFRWRAVAPDGACVEVSAHTPDQTRGALLTLGALERCRAGGVPVPRLLSGSDSGLFPLPDSGAVSVVAVPAGTACAGPVNISSARSGGRLLGRIHSALAGRSTGEPSAEQSPWLTEPAGGLVAAVERDLTAATAPSERHLARRRGWLIQHTRELRAGLPRALSVQVVHGAYTGANLVLHDDGSAVGVQGLRAVPGYAAQELAAFAFAPAIVATHPDGDWQAITVAAVGAYIADTPGALSAEEIEASADIALLSLLASEPGRLGMGTGEGPWAAYQLAVERLLGERNELRARLAALARTAGSSEETVKRAPRQRQEPR